MDRKALCRPPYLRPARPSAGWACLLLPPPSSGGYWQIQTLPDMDRKVLSCSPLSEAIPASGLGGRGSCSCPLHPVCIANIELNQTWTGKRYIVPPIGGRSHPGLGGCGSCSRPLHPVGIGNIELDQTQTQTQESALKGQ